MMEYKRYRVIKSYTDDPGDPIELKANEEVDVLERSDPDGDWPNWVLCRRGEMTGWVPEQVLRSESQKTICTEDYTAREHALEVGEILESGKELNGWIWSRKEGNENTFAWAPLNHLEKV